jgi:hypothetical protein
VGFPGGPVYMKQLQADDFQPLPFKPLNDFPGDSPLEAAGL